MKIKPKEVRRTVGILTDPTPTFMSLVDHGANQVPWNVVKHASKPKEKIEMTVKSTGNRASRRKAKAVGTKTTTAKGASQDAKLVRLNFSKTNFANKADVKKYMEKLVPSGEYSISDDNDVWAVKSTEDMSDLQLGKAKSTTTKSAGVTAFISPVLGTVEADDEPAAKGSKVKTVEGKPVPKKKTVATDDDDDDADGDGDEDEDADDDADGSDDDDADGDDDTSDDDDDAGDDGDEDEDSDNVLGIPINHDPQLLDVKKYDWYGSYLSGNDSLVGVLKDGLSYDALPPGLDEVNFAMLTAAGNILGGDDDDAVKKSKLDQLGAEFSTFTFGLYGVFSQATEDATKSTSSKRRKAAKAFVESFTTSVDKAVDPDNVTGDDEDDEDSASELSNIKPKTKADVKPKPKAKTTTKSEEATGFDLIMKRLDGIDAAMSRRTSRKGMSDSLEELGIEVETDDEEDEQAQVAKSDAIRALGGRPRN